MNGWVPISKPHFNDFVESFPKSLRESIRSIAIDFLMRARWEPGYVATDRDRVYLERGELIVGRKATAERLGCSERTYRTLLDHLKKSGFSTIRTTNRFSIVTICNYDDLCPPLKQERPSERPANRPTGDQPTDQEPTTKEHVVHENMSTKDDDRLCETKQWIISTTVRMMHFSTQDDTRLRKHMDRIGVDGVRSAVLGALPEIQKTNRPLQYILGTDKAKGCLGNWTPGAKEDDEITQRRRERGPLRSDRIAKYKGPVS